MSMSWRDRIATLCVATATSVYVLWLGGLLGEVSAGTIAMLVLGLGFAASASAVVPGFAALLAGSKAYLALASLGGLVAFACGVATLIGASDLALSVLVISTVALWAAATARHVSVRRSNQMAAG